MHHKIVAASILALASLGALPALAANDSQCYLKRYAELPVTMSGTRPLVAATINGVTTHLLIDSGSRSSFLTRDAAERLQLKLRARIKGREPGSDDTQFGYAKDFSLAGLLEGKTFHDVQFIVYGGSNRFGLGVDGILGQNVFGQGDVEFDLGNGMVRLFREKGCGGKSLAYWQNDAAIAVMQVSRFDYVGHQIISEAKLNGKSIDVVFESGASCSVLTLRAAARAGIKPDQEEVRAAGTMQGGNAGWDISLARFDVLDLGGEQIKNARILIGDIPIAAEADMLLGADFFLSHRIFVSKEQSKVFFTYNGGRVFDLGVPDRPKPIDTAAANQPAAAPQSDGTTADATKPPAASDSLVPKDVAGFRRRGAAFAGRREFAKAIADFDAAIELDPNDVENYYQRGMAKLQNRQGRQAFEDFAAALKLKPDHVPSLIERGALRLAIKDEAGARTDFDAALAASSDSDLLLRLAQRYAQFRYFDAALALLEQWISKFPQDERLAAALAERCRMRTLQGKALDLALADCNAALKNGPRTSDAFSNRALVHLRRGDFAAAVTDFNAALKLQPKSAMALYGLGIAQLRKELKVEGDKNIRAAVALAPNITEFYARLDLAP